ADTVLRGQTCLDRVVMIHQTSLVTGLESGVGPSPWFRDRFEDRIRDRFDPTPPPRCRALTRAGAAGPGGTLPSALAPDHPLPTRVWIGWSGPAWARVPRPAFFHSVIMSEAAGRVQSKACLASVSLRGVTAARSERGDGLWKLGVQSRDERFCF